MLESMAEKAVDNLKSEPEVDDNPKPEPEVYDKSEPGPEVMMSRCHSKKRFPHILWKLKSSMLRDPYRSSSKAYLGASTTFASYEGIIFLEIT